MQFDKRSGCRLLGLAIALLGWPRTVHAHLVSTGAGPFYDGTAHFFLTFQEVLPVLALSLFAGLRGTRTARLGLILLPLIWIAGGFAGQFAPNNAALSQLSATFLLLASGALLASDWKLSIHYVAVITMIFGSLLGFLNGAAMAAAKAGMLAVTGAATAAFVVAVLSAALAVTLRHGWTRIALRVIGSWLAALGLLALGWSLRT